MAAKPEGKEPAPAAPAKGAPPPAPEATPAPAKGASGLGAWLPAIVAVVLAPLATWGVAEFVLLPRLAKQLAAVPAESGAAAPEAAKSEGGKSEGKTKGKGEGEGKATENSYEFKDITVNLAGTMGTRYLRTTFIVTGYKNVDIKAVFDDQSARLKDVTINVLSSLTLADIEEPGAKNVLREKLAAAYNQVLNKRVAEQVYLTDFVIQ